MSRSRDSDPELHITVVAFTSGRGLEMTDEIALVKAALLYADRVTLASPKAVLLASVGSYLAASPAQRRDALIEMASVLPDGAVPVATWKAMRQIKQRTADQIITMKRMEAMLEKSSKEMAEKIESMLDEAKASELEQAMQAGVLELDPLGADRLEEPFSNEGILLAVTNLIQDVLGPSATTHPMFSEMTRGLARAMVQEGKIEGAELAPATRASMAGQFISALEAFPDAPMDVVLDARAKLRGPLRRFRAGVSRISRDLRDVDALDPRFRTATDELYREHVAPALEEIETLTQEMGLLPVLRHAMPGSARDLAVIALAITNLGGVDELAKLASGTATAAADVIGRAAARRSELGRERDRNEFVFLYEAGRELRE
jgi:hypothetical protein